MPTIRPMTIADHPAIIEFFRVTPGVTLREADSFEATQRYLERNPNLSFVAVENDEVIGCVMCGHDGRRGYLQHLVVSPEYRRQGIGEALYKSCIDALEKVGIYKTHLYVFKTNEIGNAFWFAKGWIPRNDVNLYSFLNTDNENA